MKNKTYDKLKDIALIGLPALEGLVATLGLIWGFDSEKIVLTISAIATFMGACLKVSNSKYKKNKNTKGDE